MNIKNESQDIDWYHVNVGGDINSKLCLNCHLVKKNLEYVVIKLTE